jgi:hypothetical protein
VTINLETEIVSSGFDSASNAAVYTIQRGSKRWTVSIPMVGLDAHKGNKTARRNYLANALETAISQKDPDPEVAAANPR